MRRVRQQCTHREPGHASADDEVIVDGLAAAAVWVEPVTTSMLVTCAPYLLGARPRAGPCAGTSHALDSDASRVCSQSFEIADLRRQHRGTRLGVSHNNGVAGGPSASALTLRDDAYEPTRSERVHGRQMNPAGNLEQCAVVRECQTCANRLKSYVWVRPER